MGFVVRDPDSPEAGVGTPFEAVFLRQFRAELPRTGFEPGTPRHSVAVASSVAEVAGMRK